MAMTISKQLYQVAITVAVISAAIMALTIGLSEAAQVVINPESVDNPLDPSTLAVYGGSVSLLDRIATAGAFVWVLGPAGLAAISASGQPAAIRNVIRYAPAVLGLIGLVAFGTEVGDILSGDYDFDAATQEMAAYHVMLAASVVAAVTSFFRN